MPHSKNLLEIEITKKMTTNLTPPQPVALITLLFANTDYLFILMAQINFLMF